MDGVRMSAKHTAGPWQINGSHFYGPDPERILLGHCVAGDSEGVDMVANLRLIAAAPDMLEALFRIDNAINNIRHDLGTQYPALSEAWGDVRAAIAAARGE
jgi:hypothetical protein